MITAGIDVGVRNVKVVLLSEGKVLSRDISPCGLGLKLSIEKSFNRVLEEVKISSNEIKEIISTGIGIEAVPFPTHKTTLINALAKAGKHFFPSGRTIIDIGAEESRVVRFDEKGNVTDFALNDMCAAGAGSFIEAMSRTLEVKIGDFAQLSLTAEKAVLLNAQCVVFAESEVVSLIHQKVPKSEIARAVYDAISERISFMVKRLVLAPDLVIVGGVANDRGFINSINRKLNVSALVPDNPEYGAALGAAIYGQGLKV